MGRELPVFSTPTQPGQPEATEQGFYSRVFCTRENSPPLRLLLDFLKSKGQVALIPKVDPAALDDWAWVRISLGYSRERKPIQLLCSRDRGSYQDILQQERQYFLDRLSIHDDEEAQIIREQITRARFLVTTRMIQGDINDDGYDFNGWILEFFQDQCDGVVQVDGHGFFSPRGELIVEMDRADDSEEA